MRDYLWYDYNERNKVSVPDALKGSYPYFLIFEYKDFNIERNGMPSEIIYSVPGYRQLLQALGYTKKDYMVFGKSNHQHYTTSDIADSWDAVAISKSLSDPEFCEDVEPGRPFISPERWSIGYAIMRTQWMLEHPEYEMDHWRVTRCNLPVEQHKMKLEYALRNLKYFRRQPDAVLKHYGIDAILNNSSLCIIHKDALARERNKRAREKKQEERAGKSSIFISNN